MRSPFGSARHVVSLAAAVVTTSALGFSFQVLVHTSDYQNLDYVEGSFVNLASFPVRPMLRAPDGAIWAVNHHNSTLNRYSGTTSTPTVTHGVPWGPCAIAYWSGANESDPSDDEILVVSRGTWAVTGISPATGKFTRTLQLRPNVSSSSPEMAAQGRMAEPGDILVDSATDRAFVSCSGADCVLQIDLVGNTIDRIYRERDAYNGSGPYPLFRSKAPLFLCFDESNRVLVAPLISGNGTMAEPSVAGSTKVITSSSLPDEDLFRIDPVANTVTPIVKKSGTILFAHGVNPVLNASGVHEWWQLNTDADNAPAVQGEPAAKGVFATNRVTTAVLPSSGSVTPTNFPSLDAGGGLVTTSVGQPNSIAFHTGNGHAFITGLLTDNVTVLDVNHGFVKQWSLPDGSIPRQVILDSTNRYASVYCWGDNKIRTYHWSTATGLATPSVTYDLGPDPTPSAVKTGRKTFFDASNSANNNLSCATCHVEGGSDFLAWNLSDLPLDDKGPMVTQTLVGIQRVVPFHWRGERRLKQFQGAFDGLLGGPPLADSVFNNFEQYVFSLTNPANPNQNRERKIDDRIHAVTSDSQYTAGNAITGEATFLNTVVFKGKSTCADCHFAFTGTGNDIINEFEGINRPRRTNEKPTPFHELWRKQQSRVLIGGAEFGFLGTGLDHTGGTPDLFRFVANIAQNPALPPGTGPEKFDISDFVHQFDQGLAPAVHFAFLLNSSTPSADVTSEIGFLETQANILRANCDVVVITKTSASPGSNEFRWYYDRTQASKRYRCDDPTFPNGSTPGARDVADFVTGASNGETSLFLGVPVGMGRRFGTDYDLDGVLNLTSGETPYDPELPNASSSDTTSPSFVPRISVGTNVELLWTSTKVARLRFETNEATRYEVRYWPYNASYSSAKLVATRNFSRVHTVLLDDMKPRTNTGGIGADMSTAAFPASPSGYDYNIEVKVFDRNLANAPATDTIHAVPEPFVEPTTFNPNSTVRQRRFLHQHVVDATTMSPLVPGSSGMQRTHVDVAVSFKRGGDFVSDVLTRVPAGNRVVIGRILRRDAAGVVTPMSGVVPYVPTSGQTTLGAGEVNIEGNSSKKLIPGATTSGAIGSFLFNTTLTSSANGIASFDFEFPTLAAGEKVIFNVEGVVEIADTPRWVLTGTSVYDPAGTGTLKLPGALSGSFYFDPATLNPADTNPELYSQWSFPDTMEKQASAQKP